MRTPRILSLHALGLALLGSACASAGRQAAWEKPQAAPVATATSAADAGLAEADAAWAKRDAKAEVEKAIGLWEKAAATNPSDPAPMISLARAYYFLVDGHVANEGSMDAEGMKALYQKGVDWGEKALLLVEPDFGKAMAAGGDFEKEIQKISKAGMPAAYWYCTNLGRFATLAGLSAKLFYKDRVAAAMSRIRELDTDYFYRAADRYFGAFYSALPSIAGKDVKKSQHHFELANQHAPQYLPNKVVQAQFLAVELDDEAMYKSLLDAVLAAPDGEDPDFAPENRAAKRSAKRMLEQASEIF